ncbi:MAG TPA: FAD-dependent oxidoreductase, partial [bacterium]|nr:FAD-dependent oxidoreductase [bacterium]
MNAKRIVVVGGSAAGPKAAAKARRLDEQAEITLVQKSAELSMASCGYPYYVGGFFDDRNMLLCTPTGVVRDPSFFMKAKNIVARTQTEAVSIDRSRKIVRCKDLRGGNEYDLPYDSLVIATGSLPNYPPVPGVDLDGVTTLQSMRDADFLRRIRDEKKIKKAVVVGGGLIGIETCEALHLAGIDTTVVELLPQLLAFMDWDMAKIVENHLRSRSVNVFTENGVSAFLGEGSKLAGVKLSNGTELPCELAVVAIGVKPNSALAAKAGLKVGSTGGIVVDKHMSTSDPCIYAAGDCVEVENLITGKPVHAPYGDLANLEGRVAGENAVLGNAAVFPGTIQTG